MGGLSHLVQRGGAWAGWISVLLYNGPLLCGFNVPVKGIKSLKTVWLVQSAVSVCVGYVYDLCRTGFLPSYLYAICGDDYSRSGGVRDYADNYSWTRTHVSYVDTETNFKVCLISVGIAGWVGGFNPHLISSNPLVALVYLSWGLDVTLTDRTYRHWQFLCLTKCQKYYIFLSTHGSS